MCVCMCVCMKSERGVGKRNTPKVRDVMCVWVCMFVCVSKEGRRKTAVKCDVKCVCV